MESPAQPSCQLLCSSTHFFQCSRLIFNHTLGLRNDVRMKIPVLADTDLWTEFVIPFMWTWVWRVTGWIFPGTSQTLCKPPGPCLGWNFNACTDLLFSPCVNFSTTPGSGGTVALQHRWNKPSMIASVFLMKFNLIYYNYVYNFWVPFTSHRLACTSLRGNHCPPFSTYINSLAHTYDDANALTVSECSLDLLAVELRHIQ